VGVSEQRPAVPGQEVRDGGGAPSAPGDPIGIVVRFDLVDEVAAAEFDRLTQVVVAEIRRSEPGTLCYLVHGVEGDPLARVFYEVYADAAALDAHEAAGHVLRFHAEKARTLRTDPRVDLVRPLGGVGTAGRT
jgi:quinol monooxygenase YgiN